MKKQKIILTVIDGLGLRKEMQGNAFALANHPTFDYLFNNYPNSIIKASGEFVGLPKGQIGNSEVGHLNIGAGRIVYTGLSLINKAIEENTFKDNVAILEAINDVKDNNATLHLMGLLSNGGVHSYDKHLFEIIKMAHTNGLKNVSIHIFGDGRDVKPQSIKNSLDPLIELTNKYGYKISSIAGRFYAMDRDKIFERNQLAYDALIGKSKNIISDINKYIEKQYEQKIYDEFFIPAQVKDGNFIKNNDSIIFFNFRPDRARQLSHMFIGSNLYDYYPKEQVKISKFVSLMKYEGIDSLIAFKEMEVNNPLGEMIANNNLKQLRLAETQKYAHVTFFMDGGIEILYKNEERILVDSIKANSFADFPQMSAKEITDKLLEKINEERSKFEQILKKFHKEDSIPKESLLLIFEKFPLLIDREIDSLLFNLKYIMLIIKTTEKLKIVIPESIRSEIGYWLTDMQAKIRKEEEENLFKEIRDKLNLKKVYKSGTYEFF